MCRRERRPLPPQLLNSPHLRAGLELFYGAFWDLTTERQLGFGSVGQIPTSAIDDWADRHELNWNQREELKFVIRKMDPVYIDHVSEKK